MARCDCPASGAYLCLTCRALLARSNQQPGGRVAVEEPERSFQSRVLRMAHDLGYLAFHDWDSRGNAKGFLDTWLAKPGHPLLALELKVGKKKATMEQQQWVHVLPRTTGIHAGVYYPRDFETICALLGGMP